MIKLAATLILAAIVGLAIAAVAPLVGCSGANASNLLRDLSLEVCVDGEAAVSVQACLKTCDAEARRRGLK